MCLTLGPVFYAERLRAAPARDAYTRCLKSNVTTSLDLEAAEYLQHEPHKPADDHDADRSEAASLSQMQQVCYSAETDQLSRVGAHP